jgi:hypothetical protein
MSSADPSLLGHQAPLRSHPADVGHQRHVPPARDRGPRAQGAPDAPVRYANLASVTTPGKAQDR